MKDPILFGELVQACCRQYHKTWRDCSVRGGHQWTTQIIQVTSYFPVYYPRMSESDSGEFMATERVGRSCWEGGHATSITRFRVWFFFFLSQGKFTQRRFWEKDKISRPKKQFRNSGRNPRGS